MAPGTPPLVSTPALAWPLDFSHLCHRAIRKDIFVCLPRYLFEDTHDYISIFYIFFFHVNEIIKSRVSWANFDGVW